MRRSRRRPPVKAPRGRPDVSLDLIFEGAEPAHLEPRHFHRQLERVLIDSCRLAQTGCWSGRLSVAGHDFDVTPDHWWGSRDRSWGVRPVGEPEPPGIRGTESPEGFFSGAPRLASGPSSMRATVCGLTPNSLARACAAGSSFASTV